MSSTVYYTAVERDLNDILATLGAIVGIVSPLVTLLMFFVIKRKIMREADELIENVIERGKGFYATEKKDVIEGLPNLISGVFGNTLSEKMSNLGQMSGVSRSMKALEKDLIADGVDQVAPGFGGLAAKYIQKYPMLMPLIQQLGPMFAKKGSEVQPQTSTW